MKKIMEGFLDALGTFSPIIILFLVSCSYLITPVKEKFIPLMPVNEKKIEIIQPARDKSESETSHCLNETWQCYNKSSNKADINANLIQNHVAFKLFFE